MTHYVQTTDGTLLEGKPSGVDTKNPEITQEQAEARCAKANADAEAMGLKVRYEVKEA